MRLSSCSTLAKPVTDSRRAGGFTLLELILVLLVLAILVAIAVPSFLGAGGVQDAKDVSYQILSLTQQARSQAMAEGTNYRLILDVPNRAYYLRKLNSNAQEETYGMYVELGEEVGRPHPIPGGITLELDATPSADQLQQAQATGQILPGPPVGDLPFVEFYPTGRIDPATIKVTDRHNRTIQVACLGPSEPFRMIVDDQVLKQ